MTRLTPKQRRELIERPFPIVQHTRSYRHTGPGVVRWTNGAELVEGYKREYHGAAFHIGRVLYGEEYYRWS